MSSMTDVEEIIAIGTESVPCSVSFSAAIFMFGRCPHSAGPLPETLGNLSKLETLRLYNNQISGERIEKTLV